eukprot:gene6933-9564_t
MEEQAVPGQQVAMSYICASASDMQTMFNFPLLTVARELAFVRWTHSHVTHVVTASYTNHERQGVRLLLTLPSTLLAVREYVYFGK